MGIDDVKGGVSEIGRAKVVVELVDAGGRFNAIRNEAKLMKGVVAVTGMRSDEGREVAGENAADYGVAGEGAGGGGVGGGGGKELGLFIGLDLTIESFGGEAMAVGGGGAMKMELL